MNQYRIEGGHPLKGRIRVSGNKNAALPCIAAALLAEEPVTLRNVPEIEDVFVMLDICRSLGASVDRLGPNDWTIDGRAVGQPEVPARLYTSPMRCCVRPAHRLPSTSIGPIRCHPS